MAAMLSRALKEKIVGLLQNIEKVTGQGAVYQGLYEAVALSNRVVCAFCEHSLGHPATASLCRASCRNATVNAMSSGEPCFYRCWAGLLFATVPVAPQNRCGGGISLGGFRTAGEERDIRDTVSQRLAAWPAADVAASLSRLDSLRQITPSALRGLGSLILEMTFSAGVNSSAFFKTQNEKYLQQRRIAEAYAEVRDLNVSPPDLIGDTYQLVSFLTQNDKAGAMEFVSRYLAKLLHASNWDLTKLKAHVRVLLGVMTSQEILRGVPWAAATSRELRRMMRLEQAQTTEESCYEVAEWIQQYFRGADRAESDGRSLAERSAEWLQAHYMENVSLADLARAVGAGVSTLVHRLRRETGRTFKGLLHEIRLSEAKKLLATTSLELSDVADRCGFFDQSHFTREFKKGINLTPGQFRRLLRMPEDALRQAGARAPDESSAAAPHRTH